MSESEDKTSEFKNPFQIVLIAEPDVPPPAPVPAKPITKVSTGCDSKAIKELVPKAFKKANELIKSAFYLLIKDNISTSSTIDGPLFSDNSEYHTAIMNKWGDLDVCVLRHEEPKTTTSHHKSQRVVCLTVYPGLLELLPLLKGTVDIAAYFPIDGTVLTNTENGYYPAIMRLPSKDCVRLPLVDKNCYSRFLGIPLESAIVMVFAFHTPKPEYIGGSLIGAVIAHATVPRTIGRIFRFTTGEKRLRKWQKLTKDDRKEIFATLKTDTYRRCSTSGPLAHTEVCPCIFCEGNARMQVFFDYEYIPLGVSTFCPCHDHDCDGYFFFFAPTLELMTKISPKPDYEAYAPNGKKVVTNNKVKESNTLFGHAQIHIKNLVNAEVHGLAHVLKEMYIVVVKSSLKEFYNIFVRQLVKENKLANHIRNDAYMASIIVNYLDDAVNKGQVINTADVKKISRKELIRLVSTYCTNQFMEEHCDQNFIRHLLNWLLDKTGLHLFWLMLTEGLVRVEVGHAEEVKTEIDLNNIEIIYPENYPFTMTMCLPASTKASTKEDAEENAEKEIDKPSHEKNLMDELD